MGSLKWPILLVKTEDGPSSLLTAAADPYGARAMAAAASAVCFSTCQSPVGELVLTSDTHALTGLYPSEHRAVPRLTSARRDDAFFTGVRDQLKAYFAGRLERFEIALAPPGSVFQRTVWNTLTTIPYGAQWSVNDFAALLGQPSSGRAVGAANGKNPLSIIVPCHRVIGSGGLMGASALKKWLREHEATFRVVRAPVMHEVTSGPSVSAGVFAQRMLA